MRKKYSFYQNSCFVPVQVSVLMFMKANLPKAKLILLIR